MYEKVFGIAERGGTRTIDMIVIKGKMELLLAQQLSRFEESESHHK